MPHSRKRSGYASSKARTRQSEARSASRTTRSSRSRAEPDELLAVCVDDVLVGDPRHVVLRRPTPAPPRGVAAGAPRSPTGSSTSGPRPERRELVLRSARRARRSARSNERVVGSAGVPAVRAAPLAQRGGMLHERHALALDRASDRAPADGRSTPRNDGERGTELVDVVAVAATQRASRRRGSAPRARRARRSRPSACRTGARCGRR